MAYVKFLISFFLSVLNSSIQNIQQWLPTGAPQHPRVPLTILRGAAW